MEQKMMKALQVSTCYTKDEVAHGAMKMIDRPKRKHISTGSAFTFVDLSRIIGISWKELPNNNRSVFEDAAKILLQYYHEQMRIWKRVNIKNKIITKEKKKNNKKSTITTTDLQPQPQYQPQIQEAIVLEEGIGRVRKWKKKAINKHYDNNNNKPNTQIITTSFQQKQNNNVNNSNIINYIRLQKELKQKHKNHIIMDNGTKLIATSTIMTGDDDKDEDHDVKELQQQQQQRHNNDAYYLDDHNDQKVKAKETIILLKRDNLIDLHRLEHLQQILHMKNKKNKKEYHDHHQYKEEVVEEEVKDIHHNIYKTNNNMIQNSLSSASSHNNKNNNSFNDHNHNCIVDGSSSLHKQQHSITKKKKTKTMHHHPTLQLQDSILLQNIHNHRYPLQSESLQSSLLSLQRQQHQQLNPVNHATTPIANTTLPPISHRLILSPPNASHDNHHYNNKSLGNSFDDGKQEPITNYNNNKNNNIQQKSLYPISTFLLSSKTKPMTITTTNKTTPTSMSQYDLSISYDDVLRSNLPSTTTNTTVTSHVANASATTKTKRIAGAKNNKSEIENSHCNKRNSFND